MTTPTTHKADARTAVEVVEEDIGRIVQAFALAWAGYLSVTVASVIAAA